MIELLISACMLNGPVCKDFSLLFDDHELSVMTCTVNGQAMIAPWQESHPQWKIRRWTCRPHDRREVSL